jgi:hypothetical protein
MCFAGVQAQLPPAVQDIVSNVAQEAAERVSYDDINLLVIQPTTNRSLHVADEQQT